MIASSAQDEIKKIRKKLDDASITGSVDPLTDQHVLNLESDRNLKKSYAKWFVYILIGQLVVMNIAFYLVGFEKLKFEQWSLNLYMGGTLAEVFGVIIVITNNLFPKNK